MQLSCFVTASSLSGDSSDTDDASIVGPDVWAGESNISSIFEKKSKMSFESQGPYLTANIIFFSAHSAVSRINKVLLVSHFTL